MNPAFQTSVLAVNAPVARSSTPKCSRRALPPASRRAFLGHVLTAAVAAVLPLSNTRASLASVDASELEVAPSKTKKIGWGYLDENGPQNWGSMNEDWAICDTGERQSPIAISYRDSSIAGPETPRPTVSLANSRAKVILRHKEASPMAAMKSLIVEPYVPPPPKVVGDAPPVDSPPVPQSPVTLTLPGVGSYRFVNFHCHTGGSEHVLNGSRARMEGHFVFALEKSGSGEEALRGAGSTNVVIGVLFSSGESTSPWMKNIIVNSVNPPNDDVGANGRVMELDLEEALAKFNTANLYTYDGSLTTPPGSEGVHWCVMGERASITEEDCMLLERFQGGPNTRPLQNNRGRAVVQFPAVMSEEIM